MKRGNLIDKFLEQYEAINEKNSRIEYRRIIKKPKKFESVLGFAMSFIVLIILLIFFNLTGLYFAILLFDLLFLAYYGVNLFTKNGFGLPATVRVLNEEVPEVGNNFENYYDNYDNYNNYDSYENNGNYNENEDYNSNDNYNENDDYNNNVSEDNYSDNEEVEDDYGYEEKDDEEDNDEEDDDNNRGGYIDYQTGRRRF